MKEQLLTTLENSRNYTLSVANVMPAGSYSFKPADAIWTFNELLHHIGYGIYWWNENYILQKETEWAPPPVTANTATTSYLTKAFDALRKSIEKMPENENTIRGVHATLDHITHHRAQAIVYLRCKEIVPPGYIY